MSFSFAKFAPLLLLAAALHGGEAALSVPPRPTRTRQWWFNKRIHNFGNVGIGGRIHAHLAKVATRAIDRLAYGGRDIRKEVLDQLPEGVRVVDFGCGVGLSTAKGGIGIDTSREMLAVAKASNPRCNFARANAVSFGKDAEFDIATVFFLLHEAPNQGRVDVIRNAIRIAADQVVIVDIHPSYAPSKSMLSGEPYVLDYLAHIDEEVRCICAEEGVEYRSFDVVEGHVRKWQIDTRKGARMARSAEVLQRPIHGLRVNAMQASGADAFNAIIDVTRHGGIDVRRAFAEFVAEHTAEDPPELIVELGCGVGSLTLNLRRCLPEARIVALDAHSAMLSEAEVNYASSFSDGMVTFICTNGIDVERLSSAEDDRADFAIASFVFHELPRPVAQEMIRKAVRSIKGPLWILDIEPEQVERGNGMLQAFEPFLGEFVTFFEDDLATRYDVTTYPFPGGITSLKIWKVRERR